MKITDDDRTHFFLAKSLINNQTIFVDGDSFESNLLFSFVVYNFCLHFFSLAIITNARLNVFIVFGRKNAFFIYHF